MNHRVMIVEDGDGLRFELAERMTELSCVPTYANNATALGLLREVDPRLVILDLDILSGRAWELLTELIRLRRRTFVIVLTGVPSRAHSARAFGADVVITKPVDMKAFLQATREALQTSRGSLGDARAARSEG